ncbi:MAG TPA: peptidoglycan DD-metalloendopeptidase family protein [Luteimonas sp.]|nr:peptidoglycan DD-metalloendopeptidase family protein [Luteimonas sp.]
MAKKTVPAATPQSTAAAQKQLEAVRAQIKSLSDQQRALDDQRGDATRSLREADGKVAAAQRDLHGTETTIAELQSQLEQLQRQQSELAAGLSRQRAELATLLRSAYALGNHEQLQLLLEQDRMSDLARVLAYHRYFEQDRQQRIVGLSAQLQSLAQVSEQVKTRQQDLLAARAKQQSELDALAAQRATRGKFVASLDANYRDQNARLNALGRDEKNTEQLLARLRAAMAQIARTPAVPKAQRTPGDANIPVGPLKLPLTGQVLAGFGGVMPDGHRSNGLLIAGAAGSEVRAVAAGRVAYADWLKGYGLLLIIDHGGGWMSLYAFNDSLLKNVGDKVGAGEAIASVGSSGGQGRPALYFELRHDGQPADPRGWLKR